jgi:hypothetical protein
MSLFSMYALKPNTMPMRQIARFVNVFFRRFQRAGQIIGKNKFAHAGATFDAAAAIMLEANIARAVAAGPAVGARQSQ